MLFGAALGTHQLKTGIAFHQLHQIRLLLALGHRQLHLAATPLPQPLLNQGLLGQGVLQKQFGRYFHWLHLAVVLFDHPLQDAAPIRQFAAVSSGISGISKTAYQPTRPHLEQLDGRQPVIGRQGHHVMAD